MASSSKSRLVPIIPDGGWGWVVVMGSFFVHVVSDGFVYSFGILVGVLMKEFNSDNAVSAMIISILTGVTLGIGPLASAVCNKYGCRETTIAGAVIAIIGCTSSYFATEMYHIIISVGVIMGIGAGFMYCSAIVIVTMYFEKYARPIKYQEKRRMSNHIPLFRRRAMATGIAVTGAGVGTVLFSPFNDYVMNHYGWRAVFLLFIGAFALCIICGCAFQPLEFHEVIEKEETKEALVAKKPDIFHTEVNRVILRSEERSLSADDVFTDSESLTCMDSHSIEYKCSERIHCVSVGERHAGYLNKKDVFYTGSITNVAEFKEDPNRYRSTGSLHRSSVSTNASHEVVQEAQGTAEDRDRDSAESLNMWKTMSNMLVLPLLLDPIFLIFSISNLLTSVGFNAPMYFLPLLAMKGVGLDSVRASAVLSTFGFLNTVGRISFGIIGDRKLPLPYGLGNNVARNRLWIYIISLAICGILTTFCFLCTSFTSLSIYAGLHGFFLAPYICLASVILVDLLGLDKLTNAFGLLLLWQGVGTVVGPPLAGYFADLSGNYVWSFVFCGVNLLISGLMLFSIPYLQKKRIRHITQQ